MNPWAALLKGLEAHDTLGLVHVVKVKGSAPRENGASMVVGPSGRIAGSIGGGALEFDAEKTMCEMLAGQLPAHAAELPFEKEIILGPDLHQCCGGVVTLAFEVFSARDQAALAARAQQFSATVHLQNLLLFGAGHVAKALVKILADLPFHIQWIDNRPDIFPSTFCDHVTCHKASDFAQLARDQRQDSFALIMSHSHAIDYQATRACLTSPQIRLVGLIGSQTKRARFIARLQDDGVGPDKLAKLHCPIGLPGVSSKEPAVIATMVAAQLLVEAEAVEKAKNNVHFQQKTA